MNLRTHEVMRCVECNADYDGTDGALWRAVVWDADDVDYVCPSCDPAHAWANRPLTGPERVD